LRCASAAEKQRVGHRQRLAQRLEPRRPHLGNIVFHRRVGRQEIREHRQQAVAVITHAAVAEVEIEDGEKLAV
jgi:hypothetical protein